MNMNKNKLKTIRKSMLAVIVCIAMITSSSSITVQGLTDDVHAEEFRTDRLLNYFDGGNRVGSRTEETHTFNELINRQPGTTFENPDAWPYWCIDPYDPNDPQPVENRNWYSWSCGDAIEAGVNIDPSIYYDDVQDLGFFSGEFATLGTTSPLGITEGEVTGKFNLFTGHQEFDHDWDNNGEIDYDVLDINNVPYTAYEDYIIYNFFTTDEIRYYISVLEFDEYNNQRYWGENDFDYNEAPGSSQDEAPSINLNSDIGDYLREDSNQYTEEIIEAILGFVLGKIEDKIYAAFGPYAPVAKLVGTLIKWMIANAQVDGDGNCEDQGINQICIDYDETIPGTSHKAMKVTVTGMFVTSALQVLLDLLPPVRGKLEVRTYWEADVTQHFQWEVGLNPKEYTQTFYGQSEVFDVFKSQSTGGDEVAYGVKASTESSLDSIDLSESSGSKVMSSNNGENQYIVFGQSSGANVLADAVLGGTGRYIAGWHFDGSYVSSSSSQTFNLVDKYSEISLEVDGIEVTGSSVSSASLGLITGDIGWNQDDDSTITISLQKVAGVGSTTVLSTIQTWETDYSGAGSKSRTVTQGVSEGGYYRMYYEISVLDGLYVIAGYMSGTVVVNIPANVELHMWSEQYPNGNEIDIDVELEWDQFDDLSIFIYIHRSSDSTFTTSDTIVQTISFSRSGSGSQDASFYHYVYNVEGYYQARYVMKDGSTVLKTGWSAESALLYIDSAPNKPSTPSGSGSAIRYQWKTWSFKAIDPDSTSITLYISWGDGTSSTVSATSGVWTSVGHSYSSTGTKYIKVKAKSANSGWSIWSNTKSVAVTTSGGGGGGGGGPM